MRPPMQPMLATFAAIAGTLALLTAAACDLAWRLVPNALPLALASAGLMLRAAEGIPAVLAAMIVAAAGLVVLAAAWAAGLIGGGDAKLAAAASLFVPPANAAVFVLATALAGGVLALAFLASRPLIPARVRPARRGAMLPARIARAEAWRIRRGILPYAVAIAAGAIIARTAGALAWG